MEKYLIDTDLYIEFLRKGEYYKTIRDIYAYETAGIYFSSVVIHELLAGAIGKRGRDNVEVLYRPFEKAERVVAPSGNIWKEAGNILSLIRQKRKDLKTKISTILNDTLIALSAKSIGATVYTSNGKDFQIIKDFFKFSLTIVTCD